MSRSTKKGPAVDPKLLKKVEAVNRSSQKPVIKPGHAIRLFCPRWSV
jgi:ribosomal protein S19